MARAFVFVLDSFGIGGAADAARYGDDGADTFGHIAQACAAGRGDREGLRKGPLRLPAMTALGLADAARLGSGFSFDGNTGRRLESSFHGAAQEVSSGKDTPSGHWEIAGLPARFDWGYFPDTVPAFPAELTEAMIREGGVPGILANRHAPGTTVIGIGNLPAADPAPSEDTSGPGPVASLEAPRTRMAMSSSSSICCRMASTFLPSRITSSIGTMSSPSLLSLRRNKRNRALAFVVCSSSCAWRTASQTWVSGSIT